MWGDKKRNRNRPACSFRIHPTHTQPLPVRARPLPHSRRPKAKREGSSERMFFFTHRKEPSHECHSQEGFICASHAVDYCHNGGRHDPPHSMGANRARLPLQSPDRHPLSGGQCAAVVGRGHEAGLHGQPLADLQTSSRDGRTGAQGREKRAVRFLRHGGA